MRGLATRLGMAAVGVMLVGLTATGGGSVRAQIASYPWLPQLGSTGIGTGTIVVAPGGLSATIYMTAARPNTNYLISSCQSAPLLATTTCTNAGAPGAVLADAIGTINGTVVLPPQGALDAVYMQDVNDSTDAYYTTTGGGGAFFGPVAFGGFGTTILPSAAVPGVCPPNFFGIVPVSLPGSFTLVSVQCP